MTYSDEFFHWSDIFDVWPPTHVDGRIVGGSGNIGSSWHAAGQRVLGLDFLLCIQLYHLTHCRFREKDQLARIHVRAEPRTLQRSILRLGATVWPPAL
jgi:hypothetical protein